MRFLFIASCLSFAAVVPSSAEEAAKPYNVLFIISDDMRAELGSYGGQAITPHLDKLAASGVRFERAYTQFPLCCPSRTSLLTGHKPTVSGVLGNRTWFGDEHPEWKSLPRWFKDHGYVTAKSGKIFHGGIDDTEAWAKGGEARFLAGKGSEENAKKRAAKLAEKQGDKPAAPGGDPERKSDQWQVYEGNGEKEHDYRVASGAIHLLNELKDQTFFIACGLSKPHSPPGAPQKFYDLYDVAKVRLPENFAARPTVPEGFPKSSIRPRNADLFVGRDATPESAREMTRAYLASCSYADDNAGRVLAELDRLGLTDRTIVVFWGDHGYQLGERGKWSKAGSLFEQGTRVPFIIRLPGAAGNGKPSLRTVESIDLYATLVDLCKLPVPQGKQAIEGRSLAPLLANPTAAWDHPAHSIWSEDGKTVHGATIRTERWRYAEFADGGKLLFDEEKDPQELKNVVELPENEAVRKELAERLKGYLGE